MKSAAVLDELTKFIAVLVEDEDLRAWFESFAALPEMLRAAEFAGLAGRMRAAGEDAELVRATALLAEVEIYEGVRRALQETLSGQST